MITPGSMFAISAAEIEALSLSLRVAGLASLLCLPPALGAAWDGVGVYEFTAFDTQTSLSGAVKSKTVIAVTPPATICLGRFVLL